MNFKRKAYGKLLEWKKSSNGQSAMLIEGARRIGKSTIAEDFAKSEYDSYIMIDFSKSDRKTLEHIDNFSNMDDFDDFYRKMFLIEGKTLKERKSVIIFDEIQLFPKARQAIKHLVKDGRYDFIETGSLISIKKNVKDILIPSEEEHIYMYPMDFEEFLWANGKEMLADYIKECFDNKKALSEIFHKEAVKLFRTYIAIGGMPEAVKAYTNGKDFAQIENIKKRIITLYENDIKKNDEENKDIKCSSMFKLIPQCLMSKNQIFKFSKINKNARFRDYISSVNFMDESMMCNLCTSVDMPDILMDLYENSSRFKLFMGDTGLFVSKLLESNKEVGNKIYKALILNKTSSNMGMIFENVVGQMLRANGYKLHFHEYKFTDKENNIEKSYEIDFIITKDSELIPIEVKSSTKHLEHESLDMLKKKYEIKCKNKYIISTLNYKRDETLTYLPIYMTFCL